jgi:hypothetical protein
VNPPEVSSGFVELFQPPRQTYVTGNDSAGTSPSRSTNTKASMGDIGGSVHLSPRCREIGTPGPRKAVVLIRRAWEFLFDQLKSTHAVVEYVRRVAGQDCELGREPVRYYTKLAQADADAPPETFHPALAKGGQLFSGPLLPMAPAASEDRHAHEMVRTLLEDIAVTRLTSASEIDRLRILAELDRLPVTQRGEIGRFVLRAMRQAAEHGVGGDVVWSLRSVRGSSAVHLGYGACSRPYSEEIAQGLRLWLQLRHHDVLEVTRDVERLTSVAVLVTPRTDGRRPWDTSVAAVSGPVEFDPEVLVQLRELFPGPE